MVTCTPIPYWLAMPLAELRAWKETVREIQDADRAAEERA